MTWSRKNLEGVETIAPTTSVYLTPERQEVQRTARAFAMEEVLPLADELDPHVDAGEPADVATSQAKLVASETAEQVTGQALQIFGGNGYTTEYSVERYWRDARMTTIFEGTSEIQRKIVSDALVGH